jgi:uncharacterized membrane protein
MIVFPLQPNARVEMIDRLHAILESVVIDPATQSVAQMVVMDAKQNRRLVPLRQVSEAEGGIVRLRISGEQFLALELFNEGQYLAQPDNERDFIASGQDAPATIYLLQGSAPSGNLAGDLQLVRGAFVEALDGSVGTIEEIEVDPETGQISDLYIVTHKQGELKMPVAVIDRVEADTVYLKLTQEEVESLPSHKMRGSKGRYDLVARIFDSVDRAEIAIKDFESTYQKHSRYWLASYAILVRDAEGAVTIKEQGDLDTQKGRLVGAIGGGLVGLIGGPVGVIVGAIAGAGLGGVTANKIDKGISDEFLERFAEQLKPGSSAIVMLVDHKSMPEISKSMENLSGVLVQEELTEQMIDKYLSKNKE